MVPATSTSQDIAALMAELDNARREAVALRLAFARSAEVIGEFLYSSELLPDQRFVLHARGPGFGRLVGAEHEPEDVMETLEGCLHPGDQDEYDTVWSYASLLHAGGRIVEQRYRLIGLDAVVRWVLDRARITVIGTRIFLDGAACDVSALRAAESERAAAVERLERLSRIDSLTGIFNRRHFSELLRARRATASNDMALALLDIDSFKQINDTYGHHVGDVVLREVSGRLARSTRASDIISRWGGEEFCVMLEGVRGDADVKARAERLRLAVGSRVFAVDGIPPIAATISIGVARIRRGQQIDELLRRADVALYEAKHAGRNLTRVAVA